MNFRCFLGAAMAATVTGAVFGVDVVTVSDIRANEYVKVTGSDSNVAPKSYTASTEKYTAYPSEVGTPIFWFDASETNGWEFADGTLDVVKIPSKVGNRYLSINDDNGSWTAALWKSWWQQRSPTLEVGVAAINGKNAVDFGVMGSKKGLLFNPISDETTGNVASNVLHNIGTVIAVYDSENYGGYILGGGFGPIDNGWWNTGFHWLRGDTTFISKNNKMYSHLNTIGRGSTLKLFHEGTARRNSGNASVQYMGLGGCWEVLTVNPKAAGMQATGIGLNDARRNPNSVDVSGGMKIAEMLIFGKVLTNEECAKVEKWLMGRYFKAPCGANGNASLGTIYGYRTDWTNSGFPINIEVPAGETLAISKNKHGYGGKFNASALESSFVKTGGGTLELRDAVDFQGVVRLNEGRLTLPQREVPSALPKGAFLHFDASASSSMVTETEDGTEYLAVWRNLDSWAKFKDEPICARPPTSANRPTVLRNVLGEGLNMLDFGTNSVEGVYLALATNETTAVEKNVSVPQLVTMVAVFGAQMGGGHLVGHKNGGVPLRRGINAPASYREPGYAYDNEASAALCNGIPVRHESDTFQSAGYQVFALRIMDTSGSNIGLIGADKDTGSAIIRSGGLQLGEIAIYHRMLSDEEMRDASAFLMRKWLNRTAPGYRRPDTAVADIQNVEFGGGEIYVPAGETVTVARVTGTAPLVKTGGGTLKVQDMQANMSVSLMGGEVIPAVKPDASTFCEIAAGPSLRLRADNAAAFTFMPGTSNVVVWGDDGWRNPAWQPYASVARMPELVAEDGPNGKPYLDFGTLGSGGKFLHLSQGMNNVRSAFVVCKFYERPETMTADIWPMPLGSAGSTSASSAQTGGTMCNFLRQVGQFLAGNQVTTMVRDNIYTNGVKVAYSAKPMSEVWQVIEFHSTGGAHVSEIGNDRGQSTTYGGFALGEMVLFERPLSDSERIATRNYLMKKWLGTPDEQLELLPDVPKLEVAGQENVSIESDRRIIRITGEGTLVKDGEATLSVDDWSALSGTAVISNGTLALTKCSPGSGELVEDGLLFHADASQGITATTNADGVVRVSSWRSASDPSWTAEPWTGWNNPTYYLDADLNEGRVVDMAFNSKQGLVFKKDGVVTKLEGIKSVVWLIGSQNGGGFLLGGGTNSVGNHFAFHRGGSAGNGPAKAKDVLLNTSHGHQAAVNADWRKNEVSVRPGSVGLSGSWDMLVMNIKADDARSITSDGFAFDGRVLDGQNYNDRIGSQRLAEVAIYDRRLTDDEIVSMEAYLKAKWQFGWQAAPATNLAVEIASGATLDCSSGAQVVGALSGAGAVAGDISALALVADGTAVAWPTVSGTFTVPHDVSVELRNTGSLAHPFKIKLLSANAIEGLSKDTVVSAAGEIIAGHELRLVVRDGALFARECIPNFRVLIR